MSQVKQQQRELTAKLESQQVTIQAMQATMQATIQATIQVAFEKQQQVSEVIEGVSNEIRWEIVGSESSERKTFQTGKQRSKEFTWRSVGATQRIASWSIQALFVNRIGLKPVLRLDGVLFLMQVDSLLYI